MQSVVKQPHLNAEFEILSGPGDTIDRFPRDPRAAVLIVEQLVQARHVSGLNRRAA